MKILIEKRRYGALGMAERSCWLILLLKWSPIIEMFCELTVSRNTAIGRPLLRMKWCMSPEQVVPTAISPVRFVQNYSGKICSSIQQEGR